MSALTDAYEVNVLNALLNNVALQEANQFISLHTADPGETGSTAELTDSGYARKSASFGTPVSGAGTCANDAEVLFNAIADAGPFTVTHFGIWTAATGGSCIIKGALATSKQFSQNDVPRFPVGSLVVTAA